MTKHSDRGCPVAYVIEVDVSLAGKFSYRLEGTETSAQSIHPKNGDTVSWVARMAGVPVPFQVDFPVFNPFGSRNRTVRSLLGPTEPLVVGLPGFYSGNRVFKYRVTVVNGWSDDPDVVPVEADGIDPQIDKSVVLLDVQGGLLTLTPENASYPKGPVTWRWASDAYDDFGLSFDSTPPLGWPMHTNSQGQKIVLQLGPGMDGYRIDCPNLNLSATGKLTIT